MDCIAGFQPARFRLHIRQVADLSNPIATFNYCSFLT